MFVSSFIGLLTFGLVFNHATTNVITKSSEDENSENLDRNIFCLPSDERKRVTSENIFLVVSSSLLSYRSELCYEGNRLWLGN